MMQIDNRNELFLREVIQLFVLKSRRNRFIELLENKRRYEDFLKNLLHDPRYLDPESVIKLSGQERAPKAVFDALQKLGAGKMGYLVSLELQQDGYIGELKAILSKIVQSGDETLVYCPEGRVGYYEGHEGFSYILRSTNQHKNY